MNATQCFAQGYAEAREKFLAAAEAAGARIESHRHPLRGPAGERLWTDVATVGDPAAPNWLLTISGTHGVEGYCGAGAQTAWLRQRGGAMPAGTAAMHVHAINPWGFAHDTRTTEDSVDLCRNFLDFAKPPPENPRYEELYGALLPRDWFGDERCRADEALNGFVARWGLRETVGVIAAGQYVHRFGPFYGGDAETWSTRLLLRLARRHFAKARAVACIDYHTGLGPSGIGQLLLFHAPGSAALARAKSWWGSRSAGIFTGESVAYALSGSLLNGLEDALPGVAFTAGAYEFGTLPMEAVFFDALRADRWIWAHGEPGDGRLAAVRRGVRDAFYVDTDAWKDSIVAQAFVAQDDALAGLSQGEAAA